jgi:hypothetical protein
MLEDPAVTMQKAIAKRNRQITTVSTVRSIAANDSTNMLNPE